MSGMIRIDDKDADGFLGVHLPSLLDTLVDEGPRLTWVVQHLSTSGDLGSGKSVLDLEKESRTPPYGIVIAWRELVDLAHRFAQVQDGVFAGCTDPNKLPRIDALDEPHRLCEVVLEAVDSSYWEIFARDDAILSRLRRQFNSVSDVTA